MNLTEQNAPIFIGVFAVVTLIFLIIFITLSLKQRKRKKELLSNPNNVEIKFDCPLQNRKKTLGNPAQTCYLIHSINDEQATIIGSSIITEAKTLVIDVEHYQLRANRNIATAMGRDTIKIDLEKNQTYFIAYNYLDNIFEITTK